MRLDSKNALSLVRRTPRRPCKSSPGTSVHAVAGIGNPERFFDMLRAYGIEVLGHPLPDHAHLRPADIVFADGRPVLMTEKDAVKCARIAGPHHWYVPVTRALRLRRIECAARDRDRGY